VDPDNSSCLVFLRQDAKAKQTCLVALNFSEESQSIVLNFEAKSAEVLFSTEDRSGEADVLPKLCLSPFEVLIAQLA
ncbi:MAG: alpha-glucosidase C-terminal domain-containing protein, partial [Anaerolineae bacterium]|nr:alpha-glucosidase C-terminal domain-containing protein [Anaerolineae bacterium]